MAGSWHKHYVDMSVLGEAPGTRMIVAAVEWVQHAPSIDELEEQMFWPPEADDLPPAEDPTGHTFRDLSSDKAGEKP